MEHTVSIRNGKQVARGHNLRDPEAIKRQDHILRGGTFEVWHDESHYQAYHRLFDESIKEYNENQIAKGHKNRTISNYYSKVVKSKQQNPVYEDIITIGNCHDDIPDELGKQILKEYYDDWEVRNPNFIIVGAYYHADERDPETGLFGAPHLHIDYIPIAHNCSRGPSMATSVTGALKEMGFVTYKAKHTAQMQWQEKERVELKKICMKYGIEMAAPKKEKRKHQDTQIFKEEQKAKEYVRELEEYIKRSEEYINNVWESFNNKFISYGLTAEEISKIMVTETHEDLIEVSLSDYIALKDTAKMAEDQKEIADLEAEKKKMYEAECSQLLKELQQVRQEHKKSMDENERYKKAIGAYEKTIEEADPTLAEEAINNFGRIFFGKPEAAITKDYEEEIER